MAALIARTSKTCRSGLGSARSERPRKSKGKPAMIEVGINVEPDEHNVVDGRDLALQLVAMAHVALASYVDHDSDQADKMLRAVAFMVSRKMSQESTPAGQVANWPMVLNTPESEHEAAFARHVEATQSVTRELLETGETLSDTGTEAIQAAAERAEETVKQLRLVCFDAYQRAASLALMAGTFEDDNIQAHLDNLACVGQGGPLLNGQIDPIPLTKEQYETFIPNHESRMQRLEALAQQLAQARQPGS
jgi:hypothetical protein